MQNSNPFRYIVFIMLIFYSCTALNAHEFWIEPKKFMVRNIDRISGDLRVGQMMKGVSYGYYPRNFKRFEIKKNNKLSSLPGRVGDKPAINIPPQGDNLITLIYSTTNNVVVYTDWSVFEKFLIEKNLLDAKAKHLKNNYPKTQFKEIYSRYAKTLIGSGKSAGLDEFSGLELELILGENPYTDDLSDGLTVTLLYRGRPIINTQIEIFSRGSDQEVVRETTFTNDVGQVMIQVSSQKEYLVNSVIMRTPEANDSLSKDTKPILWESLWASTTFRVP